MEEVLNTEAQQSSSEKTVITRIKYAVIALLYFIAIPLSLIGVLLQPLYKHVYYGQANAYFKYGIAIALIIALFLIIKLVIAKKMKVEYQKDKTPLSWPVLLGLYFGSFILVFIISACFKFQLKPVHDIGNNKPAYDMGKFFVILAYRSFGLLCALHMIENFQLSLEGLIKVKNKKLAEFIPYGSILTMLTYGVYSALTGVGASLSVLYVFFILLYGIIYVLCKKNILKAYAFCLLIFLL